MILYKSTPVRDGLERIILPTERNLAPVTDPTPNPVRPWQVVAQELSRETNSKRVLDLAVELNKALREQSENRPACSIGSDCSDKKAGQPARNLYRPVSQVTRLLVNV